jgi:hypothetical protein
MGPWSWWPTVSATVLYRCESTDCVARPPGRGRGWKRDESAAYPAPPGNNMNILWYTLRL